MIAPLLSKRALTSIAFAGLFVAVIGAVQFQHGRVYYPHVVVEIQNHAKLEFLQEGVPKDADCQATTAAIADAIRVTCPTCRIGGLGVMAGLLVSGAALLATEQSASGEQFGYLLFASLPAFLGGITEDVTKNVSVLARLALTILAAACGAWLLGAVLPRLDVPGLDTLLKWTPFAIAFTIFAVGGVANAINIIDGYNGLAAGHAVIVLAALAYVSAQVGDSFLFTSALAMLGALLGFLIWNYPKGKIFLGDGGAYLLGFWLAEVSVLLVVRHPEVSPWFPMLLLIYPVFETLFSIYRRKVLQGNSPGQPDRLHLHQVIYARLTKASAGTSDSATITRQNSTVAPIGWLMSL